MIINLPPLIQQYLHIKSKYLNTLLFFQVGDFYELFYDDAKEISFLLGIKLTKKKFSKYEDIYMSGIPISVSENYIYKLLNLGKSIAICEQINFNKNNCDGKLIKRKVVRVITPGTVLEDKYLIKNKDNVIVCIWRKNFFSNIIGYSILNIISGVFNVFEFSSIKELKIELLRVNPSEIICSKNFQNVKFIKKFSCVKFFSSFEFNYLNNYKLLLDYFNLSNLVIFGMENKKEIIRSSGCLINYLKYICLINTSHINKIEFLKPKNNIFIDFYSFKNLEIFTSLSNNKKNTLINVLDGTVTLMGKRLLRRWLMYPTTDIVEINNRHNIMDLIKDIYLDIKNFLIKLCDLERILGRIAFKRISYKDLLCFKNCLILIKKVVFNLSKKKSLYIFNYIKSKFKELDFLINLLSNSIFDSIDNFNEYYIMDGYDEKLDRLRLKNDKNIIYLNKLLLKEKKRTGIKNLKLKYNRIYGYYIQINRSDFPLIPKYYVKFRDLKYSSKFIFSDLKKFESKTILVKQKLFFREKLVLEKILNIIINYLDILKVISNYLAELDVLSNFIERSLSLNYKKPLFVSNSYINIINGRHPIIENILLSKFIPNDFSFKKNIRLLVITGPNMGGKSTYMRQIALIVIMAYIGCYVPAEKLVVGYVDKILTRIGFSDDIICNKSTFMVEMSETSYILNNATKFSLILIDELGRGTSVNEGISLAWACLEYILKYIKSITLFSTHYLELTKMEDIFDGIENIYLDFVDKKKFVLLYKVVLGICNKNYSFNVAKKAGIPQKVLAISKKKINELISYKKMQKIYKNYKCCNKKHLLLINNILKLDIENLSVFNLIKKVKFLKNIVLK